MFSFKCSVNICFETLVHVTLELMHFFTKENTNENTCFLFFHSCVFLMFLLTTTCFATCVFSYKPFGFENTMIKIHLTQQDKSPNQTNKQCIHSRTPIFVSVDPLWKGLMQNKMQLRPGSGTACYLTPRKHKQ